MPARLFFLLLLLTEALFLAPRSASADVRKSDEERRRALPAPLANPGRFQAVRGQPVKIFLEGRTSTTRTLRFIIRRAPRLGTLDPEPLEMEGKTKAFFRYTPRAGETETQDTFTFATQVEGSPASTEATVTISISDPAFHLTLPASVNAGRFVITEGTEIDFPVRNTGNASFRETVTLPEGWVWLQPQGGRFDLEPGAETAAKVHVRSRTPGEVDERITAGNAGIRVLGQAVPPFLAYPSEVRAGWNAEERRRSAVFTLQNNTAGELAVSFTAPPGFTLPPRATVPPQNSLEITLDVSARPEQEAAGEILLNVEGHTQSLKALAEPAPPALVFEGTGGDGLVDFGTLDAETLPKAERVLKIRNEGGTPTAVSAENLELFTIGNFTSGEVVAPGAEVEIKIAPVRNMPGKLREEWKLRFAGGERPVLLTAEVDPAAVNAPALPAPLSRATDMASIAPGLTPKQKTALVAALNQGVIEVEPGMDSSLPRVTSAQLVESEPDRLAFIWNPPGPGQWTYKVWAAQLRRLPDNPFPIKQFGPVDNVKVTWRDNVGRAEVTGLPPGGMFKCRIIAVNEQGRSSMPGPELTFMTPYQDPFPWGWVALWTFFAIAFVIWWRARRRQKKELWRR